MSLNIKGASRASQRGIISADAMVTLTIALGLASSVAAKVIPVVDAEKEQRVVDDVVSIIDGARRYERVHADGYSGVSMTKLSADTAIYISKHYGDGSKKNPFNGDYSAAVGSSAGELQVKASNLSDSSCSRIAASLNRYFSATCATGTVTIVTS